MWDANNSWLFPTVSVDPTIGTSYRCHAVYNGTTDRKFYVDGTLRGTHTTISNPPAGRNSLWLGQEDSDDNEHFTGTVGFAYLRPSVLSADWIAAEYSNLNNPSAFYSIS